MCKITAPLSYTVNVVFDSGAFLFYGFFAVNGSKSLFSDNGFSKIKESGT